MYEHIYMVCEHIYMDGGVQHLHSRLIVVSEDTLSQRCQVHPCITHTRTHAHTHTCVCGGGGGREYMFIYVYVYT